ncbi:MAG: hypothetical protein WD535_04255 [Thermaerobacterales bacterium]
MIFIATPTRTQMEQTLAKEFGYPDFETLCRELERSGGKGAVKKLQQKLAQYPDDRPHDGQPDNS